MVFLLILKITIVSIKKTKRKTRDGRWKFQPSVLGPECYGMNEMGDEEDGDMACLLGAPQAWFRRGMTATWGPARRCGR